MVAESKPTWRGTYQRQPTEGHALRGAPSAERDLRRATSSEQGLVRFSGNLKDLQGVCKKKATKVVDLGGTTVYMDGKTGKTKQLSIKRKGKKTAPLTLRNGTIVIHRDMNPRVNKKGKVLDATGAAIVHKAGGLNLENITISNPWGRGVFSEGKTAKLNMTDVTIENCGHNGVDMRGGTQAVVRGCNILNNGGSGCVIDGAACSAHISQSMIAGNKNWGVGAWNCATVYISKDQGNAFALPETIAFSDPLVLPDPPKKPKKEKSSAKKNSAAEAPEPPAPAAPAPRYGVLPRMGVLPGGDGDSTAPGTPATAHDASAHLARLSLGEAGAGKDAMMATLPNVPAPRARPEDEAVAIKENGEIGVWAGYGAVVHLGGSTQLGSHVGIDAQEKAGGRVIRHERG
ncbi:unnamed protein product [Pedinophyceae sp. YPF-701]|nr:unnamed protein product [Pedinophyceae sp. YPF-701]